AHGDDLPAADGAVGADAGHFLGVGDLEAAHLGLGGAQVVPEAEQPAEAEAAGRGGAQEVAPVDVDKRKRHADPSARDGNATRSTPGPPCAVVPRPPNPASLHAGCHGVSWYDVP